MSALSSLLSAHLQCIHAGAASCLLVWTEKAKAFALSFSSGALVWLVRTGRGGSRSFQLWFLTLLFCPHLFPCVLISQTSMEAQGELNSSELPGESGTTWGNNPTVNAFPPCSLTVPHHP